MLLTTCGYGQPSRLSHIEGADDIAPIPGTKRVDRWIQAKAALSHPADAVYQDSAIGAI
jgi:hypothetical protein